MKASTIKGGKMVLYRGGAAANATATAEHRQDDGCGGWYTTVKAKTDFVAILIIISSPTLTDAAHNWLINTEYGAGYDRTLDAMGQIFTILDNLGQDLLGRQDVCTGYGDLAWQALRLKNCQTGEARMNGVIGVLIRYIQQYVGTDNATGWLARGFGTGALLTSMKDYISRLLANIICAIYYYGTRGTIESWRLIKIVLQTTTQYVFDSGRMAGRMALAFGGGLVTYLSHSPNTLNNDVPRNMDNLQENIDNVVEAEPNVHEVVQAVENLEYAENIDEDTLLDDYEQSDEAENDNQNIDDTIEMMIEYLDNALSQTENSDGKEYHDHQILKENILRLSGRYDADMEVEDQIASQPYFDHYDPDMDYEDYEPELKRASSFGGIINKKDIPFIKNLNKSIQKIKKKYKFKFKKEKKSKKNKKKNKATKKNNKAGFRNKKTRSNKRSNLLTPFIIKKINTKKRRGSSKKLTKKCPF